MDHQGANTPAYVEIRDEAMKVIAEVSTQSVLTTIEKTGLMPDILFAYHAEDAQQEQSLQSGRV
ncbi:hypothetical protein [Sodalis sp. C49]|uniref:hypothetical protein n=1 Tax=Sodalis sp. C49 TaxID=3228929 RepID=UPI003965B906